MDKIESIAHGVIVLEQLSDQYGAQRRRLNVSKLRGVSYRGGFHDFTIRRGGLDVFPRLVASEHHAEFPDGMLASGNVALDGCWAAASPLARAPFCSARRVRASPQSPRSLPSPRLSPASGRRCTSSMKTSGTFRTRSRQLGIAVDRYVGTGLLSVQQVNPAELSPGEFAASVRRAVEGADGSGPAKVIVIDSLNGYLNAMADERFLTAQLHELLAYLGQEGVVTLLNVTQSGMIGSAGQSPVDTTYLADNVILFRYFEFRGRVRRAISVVKKRNGWHEQTIRELHVTAAGLQIGEPLAGFRGVLTGVPTFEGNQGELADKAGDER